MNIETKTKYIVINGKEYRRSFTYENLGYELRGFSEHLNSNYFKDAEKIEEICKKEKYDYQKKSGGKMGGSIYITIYSARKVIQIRCANHLPGRDQAFLYDRCKKSSRYHYSNDGINGSYDGAILFLRKSIRINK